MKKITFLIALIFCFSGSANAQFFKKLGKKVERAAERTVQRKAQQKTQRETEKAFDSTFNKKRKTKKRRRASGLSNIQPAENYIFEHQVEMKIKYGKDIIDADYFLTDAGNYFGTVIKNKKIENDFMTIFDIDRDAMFTFMEHEGQKTKMSIEINPEDSTSEEPSFTITATGNSKTILSYHSEEYKIIGEDMTATAWITKEVPFRLPNNFYNAKQNKNNNQTWMKEMDGWVMEMEMIDTSKRKENIITMHCLSIDSSNLTINSNEYQSLGF